MSESSDGSFSGFGSEELGNLPATEMVIGYGKTPRSTTTRVHTDHDEILVRQISSATPKETRRLIREIILEELCRGLGHHSRSGRAAHLPLFAGGLLFNLAQYGQHMLYSCPSTAITKEKNR